MFRKVDIFMMLETPLVCYVMYVLGMAINSDSFPKEGSKEKVTLTRNSRLDLSEKII